MRLFRILPAAAFAVLFLTGPAAAHEMPDESKSPFYAEIDAITPATDTLELLAIGSAAEFEIHVAYGHEVIVLGYNDEPYLRVDPTGNALANHNSPSYWANEDPNGTGDTPETASASAEPDWQFVEGGGAVSWHDHRIHWMQTTTPKVGADNVAHRFEVKFLVDGRPVTASGRLMVNPEIPFEDYAVMITESHDGEDAAEHGHGGDSDESSKHSTDSDDSHAHSDGHDHDENHPERTGGFVIPWIPISLAAAGAVIAYAITRRR